MFQLPPRTLANGILLLIVKARKKKKDNALECFTETVLILLKQKNQLDIQGRNISVEIQMEVFCTEHSLPCFIVFRCIERGSKSAVGRIMQIRLANYIC